MSQLPVEKQQFSFAVFSFIERPQTTFGMDKGIHGIIHFFWKPCNGSENANKSKEEHHEETRRVGL